jgi:hypothetical protein
MKSVGVFMSTEPTIPKRNAVKILRENFYKRKPKPNQKRIIDAFKKTDAPISKIDSQASKDTEPSDAEM